MDRPDWVPVGVDIDRPSAARTYDYLPGGSHNFAGFELVEPGLVWVPQWRPEDPDDVGDQPERSSQYAGVGRKS
jgi:hypothetical protein